MEKVINSYQDLEVWKKAMGLVTDIYNVTQTYPKEEEQILQKIIEISKMINALINRLKHP